MTEASENGYLVRVRAQVMSRDEAADGWVPGAGGGLADVQVGKRRVFKGENGDNSLAIVPASAPACAHEYYIHGTRISDSAVVLECTIKKDFHYNKVMPTFHHWVTDGQRFGLTFQTAADARAFDKGVRTAVEDLLEGLGGAWPPLHSYKERNPTRKDMDDENIFECLNLPCSSRSSSENSSAGRLPRAMDAETPILCKIALPQHGEATKYDAMYHHQVETPYVSLTAIHEYTYPQVSSSGVVTSEKSSPNTKPPLLKRDSGSIKKFGDAPQPGKKPAIECFQPKIRCRHCHEWYLESANRPGACDFAPDRFKSCIDAVSCIKCAQCMVYHCMSDSEGDFALHPCACGPPDEQCAKRWIGVTLLSLVVPCLWCYLPLSCMRRTAAKMHSHGPTHKPLQ